MEELQANLKQSTTTGSTTEQMDQINKQLAESKRLVEQLTEEKNSLTTQIEQLKADLEKAIEEKR